MKILPYGRRILVKPVERKQILVSDDGTLNEYGVIVEVGGAVKHFKKGDKIGFSVFGIEKLVIDEEKYYFLLEDDEFLLAKIED